jgi:hypothetical protein
MLRKQFLKSGKSIILQIGKKSATWTGLRTLCVFIGIKNGSGSQNDLCQLASLSPKTYRKYRDKHSSRLDIEYKNYEKAMSEAVRNTMLWNVLAFSTDGRKEIEKLGVENRNVFLRLMEAKEFPYTVECIKECWDSLAQREKDECMSKS